MLSRLNKFFSEESLAGYIIRGAGLAVFWRVLGFVGGYALSIMISNRLGASAFGMYSVFLSLLALASIPAKLGLDRALIRLLAEKSPLGKLRYDPSSLLKRAYLIAFLPICLSALTLFLLAPIIATEVYDNALLAPVIRTAAIATIPFAYLMIGSESFRGIGKAGAYSFTQHGLRQLLPLSLLAIVFIFPVSYKADLLAPRVFLIGITLASLFTFYHLFRQAKIYSQGEGIMPPKARELVRLAVPMMLAASALVISSTADTLMLRFFESDATVGKYNAAIKLAAVISFSIASINTLAGPQFSRFYHSGELKQFKRSVRFVSRLISIATLPVLLLILLFPESLLRLFGSDFIEAKPSLYILIIGYGFNAFAGPVDLILQMTGNQKAFQWILISSTVLNVSLNALLIPAYGMEGAAIATTVSLIFWNLSSLIYARRTFGFWTNSLIGS